MSEMSDFGNQIVRLFALFVTIFALISRVDFSQPKCIGRLKSTLPAQAFLSIIGTGLSFSIIRESLIFIKSCALIIPF